MYICNHAICICNHAICICNHAICICNHDICICNHAICICNHANCICNHAICMCNLSVTLSALSSEFLSSRSGHIFCYKRNWNPNAESSQSNGLLSSKTSDVLCAKYRCKALNVVYEKRGIVGVFRADDRPSRWHCTKSSDCQVRGRGAPSNLHGVNGTKAAIGAYIMWEWWLVQILCHLPYVFKSFCCLMNYYTCWYLGWV